MDTDVLLRWEFDLAGSPHIGRAQSDLLADSVRQLVEDCWQSRGDGFYVSRQESRIWITVPTTKSAVAAYGSDVSSGMPAPVNTWHSETDRILAADCCDYRTALRTTTEVALQLLASSGRRDHQEFLIRAACTGTADSSTLQVYAETHSERARRLSGAHKDTYWRSFYDPGPSPELSFHGHWLWNLVVGPQPWPGMDPSPLLSGL